MSARSAAERPSRTVKQTRKFKREATRLGLNIRALREAQGLTLEQASERMDIARGHLQKIESALINVTLASLVRIADGLATSVHALFAPPESSSPRTAAK